MSQNASSGAAPGVSVAAGRKGFKAELDDLRERMRKLGLGHEEIAAEVARRYRARPRESYRLAWGWSLNHAAARFNALAAQEGCDPQARAGMTGPHLCEHERWPDGGRKPSVYVLVMLAQMYETDVLCLLDLADHENLAPADRMTLTRRTGPRTQTPFGHKLVALMEQRGLSLREVARRVPCSASHLSSVAHGNGVSGQLAGLLDRVLDAGGELAGLAEGAKADSLLAERAVQGSSNHGLAGDEGASAAEGMSLSLPYVPGRLVIEVSGPAAIPGLLAGEAASGRLALMRGTGTVRQEVTGA
jgi:transcriptional regulator with XRE-family HTH domain